MRFDENMIKIIYKADDCHRIAEMAIFVVKTGYKIKDEFTYFEFKEIKEMPKVEKEAKIGMSFDKSKSNFID